MMVRAYIENVAASVTRITISIGNAIAAGRQRRIGNATAAGWRKRIGNAAARG
jgi:hypothetical protein